MPELKGEQSVTIKAPAEEVAANLAQLKEIVEARVAADGYRKEGLVGES